MAEKRRREEAAEAEKQRKRAKKAAKKEARKQEQQQVESQLKALAEEMDRLKGAAQPPEAAPPALVHEAPLAAGSTQARG